MKDKQWKDYWEVDIGCSYIPIDKLDPQVDMASLEDGGTFDEETMPDWMKSMRGIAAPLGVAPSAAAFVEAMVNDPIAAAAPFGIPPPAGGLLPPPAAAAPPPVIAGAPPLLPGAQGLLPTPSTALPPPNLLLGAASFSQAPPPIPAAFSQPPPGVFDVSQPPPRLGAPFGIPPPTKPVESETNEVEMEIVDNSSEDKMRNGEDQGLANRLRNLAGHPRSLMDMPRPQGSPWNNRPPPPLRHPFEGNQRFRGHNGPRFGNDFNRGGGRGGGRGGWNNDGPWRGGRGGRGGGHFNIRDSSSKLL